MSEHLAVVVDMEDAFGHEGDHCGKLPWEAEVGQSTVEEVEVVEVCIARLAAGGVQLEVHSDDHACRTHGKPHKRVG